MMRAAFLSDFVKTVILKDRRRSRSSQIRANYFKGECVSIGAPEAANAENATIGMEKDRGL